MNESERKLVREALADAIEFAKEYPAELEDEMDRAEREYMIEDFREALALLDAADERTRKPKEGL